MRSRRTSSSIRTSATPFSTSVRAWYTLRLHPVDVDDARHRDDFVAPDDERPCLPLRPRHLGVHEDILNLLAAPCETIARAPAADPQPWEVGRDPPPAPDDLALEGDGAALNPDAVVLADGLKAVTEVDAAGAS